MDTRFVNNFVREIMPPVYLPVTLCSLFNYGFKGSDFSRY